MARIRVKLFVFVSSLALSSVSLAFEDSNSANYPDEVPDAAAVNAFRQYWQSFEKYEQKQLAEGKQRYQESWEKAKKEYDAKRKDLSKQQFNKLKDAADNYKKHLKEFPNAENRPIVMLNLAQISNMIGDFLSQDNASASVKSKKEALGYIQDVEKSYPKFANREEALYLKGLILESLHQKNDALAVWRHLASIAKTTLYGVHANVAVGDHLFESEMAKQAVRFYSHALELVSTVEAENQDYEKLRIQYRLAWAAYRSADLNLAVDAAAAILSPGRSVSSMEQREKMEQDAVELIGDSLYETNEINNTQKILERREISAFAPKIGLRVLSRYASNKVHRKVVDIGEFLVKTFPTADVLPELLVLMADSYDHLSQLDRRIGALERLAMMLPAQSLWRARHKDNFVMIREMEKKAEGAARMAAAHYFEHGMATGNANSYLAAATLYEILLEMNPSGENSDAWRLKHAHCYYFSGRYEEAANLYAELKQNHKLDAQTLELAAFQLVLTREKQWREELAKAAAQNKSPKDNPIVIEYLRKLEDAVEEFANKFPSNNRSIDLLLVAASSNRDQERFSDATKYWERTLVSNPNPVQRSLAIRGLVMAATKSGDNAKVIGLTKRFLQLEDWKTMGAALAEELKGVLSAATFDEGTRLNKEGEVLEGGKVMIGIAREFPDVPQRDKLFRDGAYMLAIAGDWSSAQAAATQYLDEDITKKSAENVGDMLYLNARGQEYQIRFSEAAHSYLDLAKKYSRHNRATTGLARAESLAIAENQFGDAAQAAEMLGDRSATKAEKLTNYQKAESLYEKIPDQKKALAVAKKMRNISSTAPEVAVSELTLAKAVYRAGEPAKALESLARLARRLPGQKKEFQSEVYAAVVGEANFLLGEESREQFQDFNIMERGGNLGDNVNQKTRYFEKLVADFDKAAAAQHPEWSQRARFQTGESAEAFADELTTIIGKRKDLNERSVSKFKETAGRLRKLAQRYYSTNVLARNSNPQLYQNNPWVKKSAVKLTGYGDLDYRPEHEDQLPESSQDEIPYQWSL